ncbi:RCC1 domain-containing protein [Paenibacillus sp. EC2-1]|uniref:RCC1 domain-containing protein n=1 Tax=Paenibacillus sp. EC2-1 TaxID=3388665 RepID=UPI003BEEDC59
MHPIRKKWKIVLDRTSVVGLLPIVSVSKVSQVSDLSVREVSTATDHGLVLLGDGTVMAMGCNQYGQLGDSSWIMEQTAYQVISCEEGGLLSNIKAISAGGFHSMALDNRGQVWAWGRNLEGQLGIGFTNEGAHKGDIRGAKRVVFPQEVNIVEISAGATFSLALDDEGQVWAWGDNEEGQLGIGYHKIGRSQFSPIRVVHENGLLSQIQSISAGPYHSLALDKDGQIWGWGANWNGALGFDKNINYAKLEEEIKQLWGKEVTFKPEKLAQTNHLYTWMDYMDEYYTHDMIWMVAKRITNDFDGFAEIMAGRMQSQGTKRDGSVWAWGYVEDPTSDEGICLNGTRLGQLPKDSEDQEVADIQRLISNTRSRGSNWGWALCEDSIPLPSIRVVDRRNFTTLTSEALFMVCRSRQATEWILEDICIDFEALIV